VHLSSWVGVLGCGVLLLVMGVMGGVGIVARLIMSYD
jgi:hypothetical protein